MRNGLINDLSLAIKILFKSLLVEILLVDGTYYELLEVSELRERR